MTPRWLILVAVTRVSVIAASVVLFALGMSISDQFGQVLVMVSIALLVISIALSFWVQSRLLGVALPHETRSGVRIALKQKFRRAAIRRRIFLGGFLLCGLFTVAFARGFLQECAFLASALLLIAIVLLEVVLSTESHRLDGGSWSPRDESDHEASSS